MVIAGDLTLFDLALAIVVFVIIIGEIRRRCRRRNDKTLP